MDTESIVTLTITEAYNSDEVIHTLHCTMGFTVNGINWVICDKDLSSAKEVSLLNPKGISDALENVHCLFDNKTENNGIYFIAGKIIKLQALPAYLRMCKTVNQIPDISLITNNHISTFIDHFDLWASKGENI